MIRRYAEMECDHCGCCSHYSLGDVVQQARDDGWIVTADGKHYDSKECRDKRKETTNNSADNPQKGSE